MQAIDALMIEDDAGDAELLREALREESGVRFAIEWVERLETALGRLQQKPLDVILLDLGLPDSRGLETFTRLHAEAPAVPVIILTGFDDETQALEAVRRGAQDYLVKGRVDGACLVRTIRYAIERQRVRRALDAITSELRVANARLERLALLDPLTEVLNRRGLEQVLAREIRWHRRDESELLALVIDLDNFKRINDQRGHAAGDVVLKEAARRLQASLRATDYVARVGGDEFVILLPRTRRAEGVLVAEKVRSAISGRGIALGPGGPAALTASLGLVVLGEETDSINQLLAHSQAMLKRSKQAGKNQVSYEADPEVLPDVRAGILHALSSGKGFRAVAHPIIDLVREREAGYEFLARSTVDGFEMPGEFFPICSDAKLLAQVDRHCLRTCLAASAALPAAVPRHFNLFPTTVLELPMDELLKELSVSGRQGVCCIELSEQQIIGDPSPLAGALAALRRSGVLVAIDDVGSGHGGLESLILLEPNIVKIDGCCIRGVAKDQARLRSLQRLLKVVRALGTDVIAEGIESPEDVGVLKRLGVRYGQGYLFGRPGMVDLAWNALKAE